MVERYRRGKGKKRLLGSHQKCWIWGRNVVAETLTAGRWQPLELHLSAELPAESLHAARSIAETQQIATRVQPGDALAKLCKSAEHQGYVAKMPPFPYQSPEELLARCPPRPLLALLDSIQDPFNFGAILRSADVMGLDGVFVSETRQVDVTSLVVRSSAGAVNHVPLGRAADLVALARTLREGGLRLIAASEKASRPAYASDFSAGSVIVIGNEGNGIRRELLDLCDEIVAIPQYGHVGSLNAAVSAGILFYEARRQRSIQPPDNPQH